MTTRRSLLAAMPRLGALLTVAACDAEKSGGDTGAGPSPRRDPEPPRWVPEGAEEDDTRFRHGVQAGDATPAGVVLSVWTTATRVRLRLARARGDQGWEELSAVAGLTVVDGAVALPLDGLDPDTAYNFCFEDEDGGGRSRVGRFRTAVAPGSDRVVVFGATSCLGGNEPFPSLFFAADESLDFFCLLGDTVYADGSRTVDDYRSFYGRVLRTDGFAAVAASTSVIATWDDHEVDNNWERASLAVGQFDAAIESFRRALPQGVGPGGTGIWRSVRWGDTLEVFVLDCRGERGGGLYVSVEQMEWLKAGLRASAARFKIILNSVPITDLSAIFGVALAEDRWQGYPAQRDEILGAIEDDGITGVLWVAGDVHYAQVGLIDPAGGRAAARWEVFCGPGGSFPNPGADLFIGDAQYPFLSTAWNWCRFTCDPRAGTVRVEHIGDDGLPLSDFTLTP